MRKGRTPVIKVRYIRCPLSPGVDTVRLGMRLQGVLRGGAGVYGSHLLLYGFIPPDMVAKHRLSDLPGYGAAKRYSFVMSTIDWDDLPAAFSAFWEDCFECPMGLLVGGAAFCGNDVAEALALKRGLLSGLFDWAPWNQGSHTAAALASLGRLLVLRGHDGDAAYFVPHPELKEVASTAERALRSCGFDLEWGTT